MSAVAVRRVPIRKRLQTLLVVVILTVGLAAAALVWLRVANTLSSARPVTVPTIHPVSGIVWSGRVFSSRSSLEAWLVARGGSYAKWSSRYPQLAAILEQTR